MSKYSLSFRLHDPNPIKVKGLLGNIVTRLTRKEKYNILVEYLESISTEGSFDEDDTTSLILFASNTGLKTITDEIIKTCGLLNEDELFFVQFNQGKVVQDCRIINRKVMEVNNFKNWVS